MTNQKFHLCPINCDEHYNPPSVQFAANCSPFHRTLKTEQILARDVQFSIDLWWLSMADFISKSTCYLNSSFNCYGFSEVYDLKEVIRRTLLLCAPHIILHPAIRYDKQRCTNVLYNIGSSVPQIQNLQYRDRANIIVFGTPLDRVWKLFVSSHLFNSR